MQRNRSKQIAFTMLAAGAVTAPSSRAATLYVTDGHNNTVTTVGPGGSTTGGTPFISGLNAPDGIAFDSTGNVYVANNSGNKVSKYSSTGSLINASLGGSISSPTGVAVDSSGNVYAGTQDDVIKVTPGGTQSTFGPIDQDIFRAQGVAIDNVGNVYVAGASQTIVELNSSGNETNFSFGGSLGEGAPVDLAFDSSGNLYVDMDLIGGNAQILKITSSGNQSLFATLPIYDYPSGLAVDSGGNVYVASQEYGTISEYSSTGSLINASFASGFVQPDYIAFPPSPVPEPATLSLLALGSTALLARRRQRTRN